MYVLYRAADQRETKRQLAATSQVARMAGLLTRRWRADRRLPQRASRSTP
jgi:hypothetical protein